MKITMVGTFPPIKGISRTYCLPLADALSRFVSVDFVSFSHIYPERFYPGGTCEEDDEFQVPASHRLRVRRCLDWFNPAGWLWTGLTAPGSVLHVQWWTYVLSPVEIAILAGAKLRGTPVVMTVHNVLGHETNAVDRLLARLVFSFPDRFIVHTEENRRQLREVFGIRPERISVVPFGTLSIYDDGPVTGEEARRRLGLGREERVLLFFGNIRDYKGLDVMLRAMPKIVEEVRQARLLIAGTCWTDWREYQRLIDGLGLAGHVRLHIGYVPSPMVKVYFRAADLAVLPYVHFEAQSGPGNIATAFGTPMVVTRTGGLPSLVRDEGAVVPPGDADALARAVVACLTDDERLARMSADSAAIGRETSWDRIAERTAQLYREL